MTVYVTDELIFVMTVNTTPHHTLHLLADLFDCELLLQLLFGHVSFMGGFSHWCVINLYGILGGFLVKHDGLLLMASLSL